MGISLGDIASFATGVVDADTAATQERLKDRRAELQADRQLYIDMKTKKYESELKAFEAEDKKYKAIQSVKSQVGDDASKSEFGAAYLQETNPTLLYQMQKDFQDNPTALQNQLALYANADFKLTNTRDALDNKLKADINAITAGYKTAIENARGDSKLVNAILGKRDKEIKLVIEQNQEGENGAVAAKEIATEVDTSNEAYQYGEEKDIKGTYINKNYKKDYKTKIEKAKETDYSSKAYNKQFSDTVLTLIPNKNSKDYFDIDKDGTMTAKSSIINADVTIQKLLTNSLDDITLENTHQQTGNDTTKIDFNANKRFQLAKSHVENYGTWMADGKVLSGGSLKNLFKETSTALVVPSNSIINLNNNNLKGYDIIIPKDLRNDVGKVYTNFIKTKAQTRMETAGGTLEENINFLQRQLQDDNNGNESLTQQARDTIATALEGSGYKVNKISSTSTTSDNQTKTTNTKTSSTMDMKQEELGSGADKEDFGSVRIITIKDKVSGEDTKVPLTTKNKIWLTKNYPEVNLAVDQDTMTGDGSVMEQVESQTETKKITPQDVGVSGGTNFFKDRKDVFAILPNDMTGQEIMDKYNISFPLNKFTVYKSTK